MMQNSLDDILSSLDSLKSFCFDDSELIDLMRKVSGFRVHRDKPPMNYEISKALGFLREVRTFKSAPKKLELLNKAEHILRYRLPAVIHDLDKQDAANIQPGD